MPRTNEANALLKEERRQEILLAALALFSTNGFEATKIGDIAAEAGVSHGLIYHYFTSKEEILGELVQQACASTIEFIQTAAALPFSAAEKLETIIAELLSRLNTPKQPQYSCMLMLNAIRGGDSTASLPAILLQYIIAEGQQEGVLLNGDPGAYAYMLFAVLLGLSQYKTKLKNFSLPAAAMVLNLIKAR